MLLTMKPVIHAGSSQFAHLYSCMTTQIEIKLSWMSYPDIDSCTRRYVATLADLKTKQQINTKSVKIGTHVLINRLIGKA